MHLSKKTCLVERR